MGGGDSPNFENEPPNSDVSTNASSAWLTSTERSPLHRNRQTVNLLVACMRALQGAAVLASRQAMRARLSAQQTEHAAAGRVRSKAAAAEKKRAAAAAAELVGEEAAGPSTGAAPTAYTEVRKAQKEKRRKGWVGGSTRGGVGLPPVGGQGWGWGQRKCRMQQ
jgi:hypothetical protein